MPARLDSKWEIRVDRRRRSKRTRVDRSAGAANQGDGLFMVRPTENGHDDGAAEYPRPDAPGRNGEVRKIEDGHRPILSIVERSTRRYPISRRRTRQRKCS